MEGDESRTSILLELDIYWRSMGREHQLWCRPLCTISVCWIPNRRIDCRLRADSVTQAACIPS